MERKNGETFEFEGKKLKVVENNDNSGCEKCFFCNRECSSIRDVRGFCSEELRTDKKHVIFVKAKDEQPQQAEQPQLNLCEILKNCPEGTELWSDNYGIVKFVNVGTEWDTPIEVELADGQIAHYTEEGWHDKRFPANCLLWPSKDCRDWSKFIAPWLKKERFDPKILKPFDRILVSVDGEWHCDFFSRMLSGNIFNKRCIGMGDKNIVIPYNDETKHLVGTANEAPDFYRYWEE